MEVEVFHCQECGKRMEMEDDTSKDVWIVCPDRSGDATRHSLFVYDPITKKLH